MKNKKRIKVLFVLASLNRGGAETFVVNLLRHFDLSEVEVSFLLSYKDGDYENEVKQIGASVYYVPHLRDVGPFKLMKALDSFFKTHTFDVLHSHIGESSYFYLKSAKKNGVETRICHAHSVSDSNNIVAKVYKSYLRKKVKQYSSHFFACSKEAGVRLFGDTDFKVVNNAIDLSKFETEDLVFQQRIKDQFKISKDDLVIGHVGRFETVKNHEFLLETFSELLKKRSNVKLLLAGIGPLKEQMEAKVKELGISEHVCFLGIQESMVNIYRLFDVFLFTSLFESFGIVLLEAQICGCSVVCPSHITKEVDLGGELVSFLDLTESSEYWASKVDELLINDNTEGVEINTKMAKDKGFDAKYEAIKMLDFYSATIS